MPLTECEDPQGTVTLIIAIKYLDYKDKSDEKRVLKD
jgi:hypothetical protein